MSLGRLGGTFALLYASHSLADHWVQTGAQAAAKGKRGGEGRRACAAHVATLTATQALTLAAGAKAAGEHLNPRRVVLGLAINAATHYIADRRTPLRWAAERLAWMDKAAFHDLGKPREGRDDNPCLGTGAYALDQAFHVAVLAVVAAIIARP